MKAFVTILIMLTAFGAKAQTRDCRDVQFLLERVWKHEQGSAQWQATIDSAINICPDNARLWGDKTMAHMLRGDFVEAMKFANKAAALDPHYFLGSRAWYRINYIHDYKGAIADIDELERISGRSFVYVTNIHMYMLKGVAYRQMGNMEKALEAYNLAIDEQVKERGPEWVGSYDYLFRGILKYRMNDMDGAIEDLTRQVKEYEALADTYYYRGLAYASVGRKDEARQDLQHAKELILGDGQRRWEPVFVLPDEVYLSDVEKALLRLY
jgi:tetratricopeptide (TPR) repeat protein